MKPPVGDRTTAWRMLAWGSSQFSAGLEKNQQPTVAATSAITEMISARRRASRCSMTDIRVSSTVRGERRLLMRAIARRLRRLFRVGGGRGGVGGGRGGLGLLLLLLLLCGRARQLFGDLVGGFSKLLDGTASGAAQLGQLTRPEDDENDDQQDDQEAGMYSKGHCSVEPQRDYTHVGQVRLTFTWRIRSVWSSWLAISKPRVIVAKWL